MALLGAVALEVGILKGMNAYCLLLL